MIGIRRKGGHVEEGSGRGGEWEGRGVGGEGSGRGGEITFPPFLVSLFYTVRRAFRAQCLMFKREMLVGIDGTGSDSRNHIRKYGYSLWGRTPECHRRLFRGNSDFSYICRLMEWWH